MPDTALTIHNMAPHVRPRCAQVVALWRKDLQKINPKAAESLADPGQYANLFPGMDLALQAEQLQVRLLLNYIIKTYIIKTFMFVCFLS